MESKCHNFSYAKIHVLKIYISIYVHKSSPTTLYKGLRKNIQKKREGKIGEHKLNEMGTLNVK